MRLNLRRIVGEEIRAWVEYNPREVGERKRDYIVRARRGVEEVLREDYAISPSILMVLLQLLPLLIEWFLNRRT